MIAGEKNLITVYPIKHYASTSGSAGSPKRIPVSRQALELYKQYGTREAFGASRRYFEANGEEMPYGRGLLTAELTRGFLPNGVPFGCISATAAEQMRPVVRDLFTSPEDVLFPEHVMDMKYLQLRFTLSDPSTCFMSAVFVTMLLDLMRYLEENWDIIVDDIERGGVNENVDMPAHLQHEVFRDIKPMPERAYELKRIFKDGFDTPIVPRLWPNLKWIYAIGTGGFASFTDQLRRYTGNIPIHFAVYGASEALMAVATELEKPEYTLIPQSGFYEFLPVDAKPGERPVTIDRLETGKDYEIIITNISGFYRYRIEDVVRVLGFDGESPKLCFRYRMNQAVSIDGEKTTGDMIEWVADAFAKEFGIAVHDFCVYADTQSDIHRYVILIEPKNGQTSAPTDKQRDFIDVKLNEANPSIAAKQKLGLLGKTETFFLPVGTNARWKAKVIASGVSANQVKPVRVIDTDEKKRFFLAGLDGLSGKDGAGLRLS